MDVTAVGTPLAILCHTTCREEDPKLPRCLCERPFTSLIIRRLWEPLPLPCVEARSRHLKRNGNVLSSTRDLQQLGPDRARVEHFAVRKKGIKRKMNASVIRPSHVFGPREPDDVTTLDQLGSLSSRRVHDS